MGIGAKIKDWFFDSPAVPDTSVVHFGYEGFRTGDPTDQLLNHLMSRLGSIDREMALSVPAVLRGRNMICSFSTLPLQSVNATNQLVDNPLLRQIDPNVPNSVIKAQLIEDLLFEAVAWLRVTERHSDGYPYSAVRYAPRDVSLTPPHDYHQGYLPSGLATHPGHEVTGKPGTHLWMGGEAVPYKDVIRFDSPNPPLLVSGARAIGRAIALDMAADLYATQQRMRGYFSPGDPSADPASDEKIIKMLDDFAEARAKRLDGYIPAALKYNQVSDPTPAEIQLILQQQRADLAIANALGIDPEDLGINTTSRTYQNATDRRKDRLNDVLAPYMSAITDRLGMRDVSKRGNTVRFYVDDYLKADPRTRAEVQQMYLAMGATDAAEIRQEEGKAPRQIDKPVAPSPQPPRQVDVTVGQPIPEIEGGQ